MPLYHNMRRDPSGNLFVAGSVGGMGVHTVNFTPTPSITPTRTPSPTVTPTKSPIPSVTPTVSFSPTPSSQSSVFSTNLLRGINYDNSPDSVGWDGGGYSYSWEALTSAKSLSYSSSWSLYYYVGSTNATFYVPGPGAYGQLGVETPCSFKIPQGYTGIYIANHGSNGRGAIFTGSSVDGDSTLYYTADVLNKNNNTYRTITGSVFMNDWCTGSPSNTVDVAMNRRTSYGGSPQYLNCRIYFYNYVDSSATYSYEKITGVRLYNPNNTQSRIMSFRFV